MKKMRTELKGREIMEIKNEHYQIIKTITENVERVIIGKTDSIYLSLVAILSKGHMLIEDVPGVGKTMLIRALSKTLGGEFKRIQFTPDLLPSDVTGVSIFNQKNLEFEYRPGPIMANIVLADEINRTSPKTQSALLEAMEESMITIDGKSYPLPAPFFVMATQNPIEYEGTFPLPEAQLDRFLLKIKMGYPSLEDEVKILEKIQYIHPIEEIEQKISMEQIVQMQESIKDVYIDDSLRRYIVEIVDTTRKHRSVYLGASPRGSIALFRGSQALALIKGRDFVVPDDIKFLADPVLNHRIILKSEARLHGQTVENMLSEVLKEVSVPVTRTKTMSRKG